MGRRWMAVGVLVVVVAGCSAGAGPTPRTIFETPPSASAPASIPPSEAPSASAGATQTVTPTAAPTDTPTPSETIIPSAAPTLEPTPAATLGELSPAEQVIAALVPDAFRNTCTSSAPAPGALGTIECVTQVDGDNVRVHYSKFALVEDMEAAYENSLRYMDVTTRDQGSCSETWPAEGSYTIAGVTGGRVACAVVSDTFAGELETIAWTNDALRVSVLARGYGDITEDALLAFWSTGAGPLTGGAAASPGPSAVPAPTGSLAPVPSGSGAPFPTAAETALLEHIPSSFRAECSRYSLSPPEATLAAIQCPVALETGEMTVSYFQWPSQEEMDAGYSRNLEFMGVSRDTGSCANTWPAEGTYSIGGEAAGRVGCGDLGGTGVALLIAWTDDQLLISALAEGFGARQEQMYEWWLGESGPVR